MFVDLANEMRFQQLFEFNLNQSNTVEHPGQSG
jgi:hypothetical protein